MLLKWKIRRDLNIYRRAPEIIILAYKYCILPVFRLKYNEYSKGLLISQSHFRFTPYTDQVRWSLAHTCSRTGRMGNNNNSSPWPQYSWSRHFDTLLWRSDNSLIIRNKTFVREWKKEKNQPNDLSFSLWYSLAHYDTLWRTMILSVVLWYSLTHYDTLWRTMILSDALWYSLLYYDILCRTMIPSVAHWPDNIDIDLDLN